MDCPDLELLRARMRADLNVYRTALIMLERSIGEGFAEAYQQAERNRLVFEAARATVDAHLAEHGCGEPKK